jgi:hypothetical protein
MQVVRPAKTWIPRYARNDKSAYSSPARQHPQPSCKMIKSEAVETQRQHLFPLDSSRPASSRIILKFAVMIASRSRCAKI